MFRNYLKMAWKVLSRRKFFTFVSLFGIGVTLTAILIVVALADHQLAASYPETQLDRMLVLQRMKMSGEKSSWWSGPGFKLIERYTRDLPGVERMSVYTRVSETNTFLEGRKLTFQVRRTDAEYWKILQFNFVEGAAFVAEDDQMARRVAVISESARRRYFDDQPALGHTLELSGLEYRVVGVVQDVPVYRLMGHSEIWLPLHTETAAGFFDRLMGGCQAAFLLEADADKNQVTAAFTERMTRVEFDDPERYQNMDGLPMTRLENIANEFLGLDPGETAPRRLMVFAILAILGFMALPAINLVNINLSRIYERSSEIGVRKAFGASGRDLVMQFVIENVFLSIIGGLIGLAGAFFLLWIATYLPQIPGLAFGLNWRVFTASLALAILFGLLSGVWPAWKMSRQHPVVALRGGSS
jgi:putative ABC transport system permease protein